MALLAYQLARALKWLLWLGFIGYILYFIHERAPHLDRFGLFILPTDPLMLGLLLAALATSLLQLYLRGLAYREVS